MCISMCKLLLICDNACPHIDLLDSLSVTWKDDLVSQQLANRGGKLFLRKASMFYKQSSADSGTSVPLRQGCKVVRKKIKQQA